MDGTAAQPGRPSRRVRPYQHSSRSAHGSTASKRMRRLCTQPETKQIVMIFDPKQGGPVLGFTAAMAVLLLGFFVPIMFGRSFAMTGSPNAALWIFAGLYAVGIALNYWYYWRRGAEKPC